MSPTSATPGVQKRPRKGLAGPAPGLEATTRGRPRRAASHPHGRHRPRPVLPLPSNAAALPGNAARPIHAGKPAGVTLPPFSSVLPRAGCRAAAAAGERESCPWAGTAAAAQPVSGVKERPGHPWPQGSASSTRGNRARPAPTAPHARQAGRRELPGWALGGGSGFARDRAGGRGRGGGD